MPTINQQTSNSKHSTRTEKVIQTLTIKNPLTINTDRKIPQTEQFNPPEPQPTTGSSLRFIAAQFKEWEDERAAGHTTHDQYEVWLDERIDDNRRLAKQFAAREFAEEQNKSKRLLANSFPGWGQGLRTKVTMKMNEETTTHLPHEEGTPQPAPAPAAELQGAAIMMTSTEEPLLSASRHASSTRNHLSVSPRVQREQK